MPRKKTRRPGAGRRPGQLTKASAQGLDLTAKANLLIQGDYDPQVIDFTEMLGSLANGFTGQRIGLDEYACNIGELLDNREPLIATLLIMLIEAVKTRNIRFFKDLARHIELADPTKYVFASPADPVALAALNEYALSSKARIKKVSDYQRAVFRACGVKIDRTTAQRICHKLETPLAGPGRPKNVQLS